MKLTERQERMVQSYLKQVAGRVQNLPPEERARTLANVKSSIHRSLETAGNSAPGDEFVARVLREAANGAAPVVSAQPATPEARETQLPQQEETESGWLGVCSTLAERFAIEAIWVRVAFVAAGFLTGPIAVLVYLGLFLNFYVTAPGRERPNVDWWELPRSLFVTTAWAAGLYAIGRSAFWGADQAWAALVNEPLLLGKFGWLEPRQGRYLFWTLFVGLPLTALSAMPLRNDWDYTWRRIAQAGLAIYAVVISFGIGSLAAGIILRAVDVFAR
ncbi:MAG: PspC domain-containing protein [Candidatus Hydrogenedentota bacterium]